MGPGPLSRALQRAARAMDASTYARLRYGQLRLRGAFAPTRPDRGRPDPLPGTDTPVVSCLMVTRGRPQVLGRAVACFLAQTVEDAELLVVHDAGDETTAAYVAGLAHPRIRAVAGAVGMRLGALRNLAVAHARGAYVAQWDDDDWYAPARLRTQLDALHQRRKAACVLTRWTLFDASNGAAYRSGWRLWEGSLVARRDALDAYDDALPCGEDTPVVEALLRRNELTLLDRPDLYVYTFHGANTFGRAHWERLLASARPLQPAHTAQIAAALHA